MDDKYIMHNKGFSLIELMVVIAIVSVIAAVAVPAYSTYITKAKLSKIKAVVEHYTDISTHTYVTTGTFGQLNDMGLPGLDELDMSAFPSGYMNDSIAGMSTSLRGGNGVCNNVSIVVFISNFGKGDYITDANADYIIMNTGAVDVNGIIEKRCFYQYNHEVPGVPQSGNFISGCTNVVDSPGASVGGSFRTFADNACQ